MLPMSRSQLLVSLSTAGLVAALGVGFLAGRRLDPAVLRGRGTAPASLPAWTRLADAPMVLYESAIAVIGEKIYVFGGFRNAQIQASGTVWVYDPADGSWTPKRDMPTVRTHANTAMLGDTIWFAGGFVGDNPGPATDEVWRYEWRQDRWTPGPPLPERRGGGGLVARSGGLHYFGGYGPDRTAAQPEHWVLSDAAIRSGGRWEPAAPLPKPRGHLGVATVGDRIYAIGGTDPHDPIPLDLPWVHRYDPASDSWTEVGRLPISRSHIEPSTVVRAGRIVIVGGRSVSTARQGVEDVTEYDPASDRWTALPPLPKPLHSPFAAVVGERIIVGQGAGRSGAPDNVEIWSIRTDLPWSPLAPPPVALGEVSAGSIGGRYYVVGEGAPWTLGLDLATGLWDPVDMHASRAAVGNHHAAEVWNGQLYLFGGFGALSNGMVQVFDPTANLWRFGTPMPFAAGAIASALIGSHVYLAGGLAEQGTTGQATRFDPRTETWNPIAPMPLPRSHAAAATDGRRLFVFGGRGPGSDDGFDEVQIYDPATDTWVVSGAGDSAPARLPQARGGMGKAVYDGREFWVFGGETLDGPGANRNGVYSRVDIYDPVANRWRSGPPMPTPRHGIFPLLVDNRILVVGGGTRARVSGSRAAERLDLAAARALRSP